ncbi:glutamate-rich protein 3 [Entelurus aequoreus]|uniref:glutamate-rich protein 3 n=1 Tax=Entelurus aequoreus TaxID=161455 RepID=UPI002B1D08F9|nr:glutamate-rich protein 3 [Entelurus aequoreus]
MSHFNPGLISAYNSLTDKHLTGYFSSTRIRKHLQRAGLITRSGRIVPDKEYRHKLVQRAHKRHVRECLAQAIFLKVLEMERLHQIEIKRKLEEFARRERVHKMKVERSKRFEEDTRIMSPHPPTGARAVRKQHSGPVAGHCGSSESPGSSRPNTAPGKMQKPVRLKPIHNNNNNSASTHRLHEAFKDHHPPFNCTMERAPRRHTTTLDPPHGVSPYCLPVVNNFVMPLPPATKRKERGPDGAPRSTLRRRRLRPVTASSGADEQPLLRTTVHQSKVCVTMVYFGKSVHLSHDLDDLRDEIKVFQQHCGGENLCVYKGKLREGEMFQFVSRRHPGFPFSLTFFLNGLQVERLSSCCEFKHRKGPRLGGRHGHFGFTAVERASPCYKCIIAMGLDKKPTPPPKKVNEKVGGQESSSSLKDAPKIGTVRSTYQSGRESSSPQEQQTQHKQKDDYEEDFEAEDDKPNEKKTSSSPNETDVHTKSLSDSEDETADEEGEEDVRPRSSSSSTEESDSEPEEEVEEPEEILQKEKMASPPVEEDQENPEVTEEESAEVKDSDVENSAVTPTIVEVSDSSLPTADEKEQTEETPEEQKEGEEAEHGGEQKEPERAKSVQEKLAEAILKESRCSSEPELSDTSTEEEEEALASKNQEQRPENDVAVMGTSIIKCEESPSNDHEEPNDQAEADQDEPQKNKEHQEDKEADCEENISEGGRTLEAQDNALAISVDAETTETKAEKQEALNGHMMQDELVSTETPAEIKENNVNDESNKTEPIEREEIGKPCEEIIDQMAKCEEQTNPGQPEENLTKEENTAEETNVDINEVETKKDAAEASLKEENNEREDSHGPKSNEAKEEKKEDTEEIIQTNTEDGVRSEARQKDGNKAVESNVTDEYEKDTFVLESVKINEMTTTDAKENELRQKNENEESGDIENKIVIAIVAKHGEGEEINVENMQVGDENKNEDLMEPTEEETILTNETGKREETSKKDENKAEVGIDVRDRDEAEKIEPAVREGINNANTDNVDESEDKDKNKNENVMDKSEEKVVTNEATEKEETSKNDKNEAKGSTDFWDGYEEDKKEKINNVNTDNVDESEEKNKNKKEDVMDEAERKVVSNEAQEREETSKKDENEAEASKDYRDRDEKEKGEAINTDNVEDSESRDINKNKDVMVKAEEEKIVTNETKGRQETFGKDDKVEASEDVRDRPEEEKIKAKEGVEENEEKHQNKNGDVTVKAEEEKIVINEAEKGEVTSEVNAEETEKMPEELLVAADAGHPMSTTEDTDDIPMKHNNERHQVDAENGETSTGADNSEDEPNKSGGTTLEHFEEERKDESVEVKKNNEESGYTHEVEIDAEEVVSKDHFEPPKVESIEDFKLEDLNSSREEDEAGKTNKNPKTDHSTAVDVDLDETAEKLYKEDNLSSNKKVASTEEEETKKASKEGASVFLQPQPTKDQSADPRHGESPEALARASSAELVTKWLTMHQASKFFETYVEPLDDFTESDVGNRTSKLVDEVSGAEVEFESKAKGDTQSKPESFHFKDERVTNQEVDDEVRILTPNTISKLTTTEKKGSLTDDNIESTHGNILETFQNDMESMSGTKPVSLTEKETEAINHFFKTEHDDDKDERTPPDEVQTTPGGRTHNEGQDATSMVSQEERASVKAKPTNGSLRIIDDDISEDRLSVLSADKTPFGLSSYSLLASARTESGH